MNSKNFFASLQAHKAKILGAVSGATMFAGSAFAQDAGGIDVSAISTLIASAAVAVGVIGLGVLGVTFGAKAYKWVTRAG